MFSLAYNLPKATSNFCPLKLRRKTYVQLKWVRNTVNISARVSASKKVRGDNVDFSTIEITF